MGCLGESSLLISSFNFNLSEPSRSSLLLTERAWYFLESEEWLLAGETTPFEFPKNRTELDDGGLVTVLLIFTGLLKICVLGREDLLN